MDEDAIELVTRLCTAAGMMMEDASALAITINSSDTSRLGLQTKHLIAAADDIRTLLAAADTVICCAGMLDEI